MTAPVIGTPGAAESGANVNATPGIPAGITDGTLVLALMVVGSNVNPAAGTGFAKKYSSADIDAGSPTIIVEWKRATGTEGPGTYTLPTGSGAGQHTAQVWPVEHEENDTDPFFASVIADRQTATGTWPTAALASVPAHATLVLVLAAGAGRTPNATPSIGGVAMQKISGDGAQLLNVFKLEDYAGGNPSVSGITVTAGEGNTALTSMMFAFLEEVAVVKQGSASGGHTWSGTASGSSGSGGSASGGHTWSGTASGERASRGSASGGHTWFGTAQGPNPLTEHVEDWADLSDVNATGVQVVGNRLYSSGPSGNRGYVKAFDFPASGRWRYQQLIYNVDAGLQNPTIKLGISCGDPAVGIADNDPDALGIVMQFATRARSSFKGSALSSVPIQDEQIVGVGPEVDAVLLFDITADETSISFSLKDVTAVREVIAFRIARSALADAGKSVTKIYAFFTDARTTTGASLSPFIFQTGSIGPTATKTVAGQLIEGRGQRVITTKQSDDSPMEWWAATPPGMTDSTPIIVHCPQSLTGDGHDAWTDVRMEPITAAVMDGYIWLSSTDTEDRFGNQVELDNYTALLDWCATHFGGDRDVFLFGTSMGTMVCVNLLGRGVGRALAVIGFAGGFDWLWNNVTEKRPEIEAAFGVASDGSDLREKTTGYDPLLDFIDDPDFNGKGFRFYTGTSDAITPTALSTQMSGIALDAGATEADVIEGSGGHLDASQYHGDEVVALYERNASPNAGSATGSWSFAGTASGETHRSGSSSGSWTVGGTADGATVHKGSAGGGWSFTGSASGQRASSGSAAGAHTWSGSASGETGHSGAAVGAHQWTGTADGRVERAGSAAGSWSFSGHASGGTGSGGSASGGHTWSGTAAGTRRCSGTATGGWSFGGTSSGRTLRRGSASGSHAWSGTASGGTGSGGSASGGWTVSGHATGRAVHQGSASGGHTWSGRAGALGSKHHMTIVEIPRRTIVIVEQPRRRITITEVEP